jgi:inner membrane protein
MPLPVAHSLAGAAAVAAVRGREGTRRRYYLALLAGAALANAADLDFILVFALGSRGWHRGFTHSLVFALAVCAAFLLALGVRRAAAGYGLAYATHALLDFATTREGGGLELLWPFSAERFGLRRFGLSEIPSRVPPAELFRFVCVEFAVFAPLLLAVLLWRRRTARAERG